MLLNNESSGIGTVLTDKSLILNFFFWLSARNVGQTKFSPKGNPQTNGNMDATSIISC
jgi:hypothetical protein